MLNLLPPQIKQRQHVSSKVYGVILAYFIILVALGLSAAALATYEFGLSSSISDKQNQLDSLASQKKQASQLADKLAFIEDRVKSANGYTDAHHWDRYLTTLASDTPTSVELTSIKLTTDPAKGIGFALDGQTSDPRDVILFQQKLATESSLKSIAITNMVQSGSGAQKTFQFSLTMGVNDANPQ